MLTSCSPDLNGHYTGYVSVIFGLMSARIVLTVEGEQATLRWPDGSGVPLHASRHGDRLVLHDDHGDSLTFHVVHNGYTLHCTQCGALHLPDTWERQSVDAPTVNTDRSPPQRPPRGGLPGRSVPLDGSE